jgi:hypothetical protein
MIRAASWIIEERDLVRSRDAFWVGMVMLVLVLLVIEDRDGCIMVVVVVVRFCSVWSMDKDDDER